MAGAAGEEWNLEELHFGIVLFRQRSERLVRRLERDQQSLARWKPDGRSVDLVEEEVDLE